MYRNFKMYCSILCPQKPCFTDPFPTVLFKYFSDLNSQACRGRNRASDVEVELEGEGSAG